MFFFSPSLAGTTQHQVTQAQQSTTPQQQQPQTYNTPQSFANYVYDPSTGYYYNSTTGLYYDANTQVILRFSHLLWSCESVSKLEINLLCAKLH